MLALIAIMSCSACRDGGPAASEAQSYWFLPAVAKQLDAAGRLPGTRPQRFTDSEISAERAGALADKLFAAFGQASEAWWTYFAGRPIRAAELTRCRRIDFIEHPYVVMPNDASDYFRARNGSQWLVRYCGRDNQLAVETYVSAQGLNLSLDSLGEFRNNVPLSNFNTRGIRLDLSTAESSESASRAVFGQSPNPIADIPRMIRLSRNWAPWVISWAVTQSQAAGDRTAVLALPKGKPTQWVVRPADSASVELDSLMDIGVTPAVLRVLRRRTEAATSQEFPQTQNQRDPRQPVAPSLMIPTGPFP